MEDLTYFSEEEACEYHLIPGITVIIPTFSSNPKNFALGVLSLLVNSDESSSFNHVIVTINGPDERTGDPSNQDIKQKFLEAIRGQKYKNRDMPITVQRIWSRLGHGECLDSAIPWVHTKTWVFMHDDVLVCDKKWTEEVDKSLSDDNVAWVYAEHFENLGIPAKSNTGKMVGVTYPHPNGAFMAAKKSKFHKFKWSGFFSTKELDGVNFENSRNFYKSHLRAPIHLMSQSFPEHVNFLSYDVGAFPLSHALLQGQKFVQLKNNLLYHKYWPVEKIREVEKKLESDMPFIYNIYHSFFG